MKTTLKTRENENYTQNDWNYGPRTVFLSRSSSITLKLHSKRVRMKTKLKTSETTDLPALCLTVPEKFVHLKTTLNTSENENLKINELW
jgi:hypothetical protein